MTEKKYTFSLGVVLLAAAIGLLCGVLLSPRTPSDTPSGLMVPVADERTGALMQIIDHFYVDEVDHDSLSTIAVESMLSALDPHSSYLSPQDYDKEVELIRGRFEGIGVTLAMINDTVCVSSVIQGSPGALAGMQPGDRILKVDSVRVSQPKSGKDAAKAKSGKNKKAKAVETNDVESGDITSVVDLIRGPRYSTVTLTVDRKGSPKPLLVKIKRDVIHHASIPVAIMIDKQTGYIHVSRFAETTSDEFHNALLELNKLGMKHLVLDLRGNRGGTLESAVRMADELLPKGDLIVYTEGAHQPRSNIYATSGGLFESGRLTILLNEFSASASEVVAGAIQDNDRGLIAGRCSFGKGLVQRQFDLPTGDAVLLTIARYYSPSGRCIQRPYDKGADAYNRETQRRYNHGELFSADSIHLPDSLKYKTAGGRTVYGGGGIMPDVFVPIDTTPATKYYTECRRKGILNQFPQYWADIHREDSAVSTFDTFLASYERLGVDTLFVAYAAGKGVTLDSLMPQADTALPAVPDNLTLAERDPFLHIQIKALLADCLFGRGHYYQIMKDRDPVYQKALFYLRERPETFEKLH